jgi:predicted ABC-type ATPase
MGNALKFSVIAGPIGAGKSTLLDTLKHEGGFPLRVVIEHEGTNDAALEAIRQAILFRESVVVETALQGPEVAVLMQQADDRGFEVELVIVGVESPEILGERLKRRSIDARTLAVMFETTMQHLPVAADQARRVMVIDNSAGPSTVALQPAAAAQLEANDKGPSWVVNRLLRPKIERDLSKEILRRTSDRIAAADSTSPVLQYAKAYAGGTHTGPIVERTNHHVLQCVSDGMHLVHDLALISQGGGFGLVKGVVASISYQFEKSRPLLREAAKAIDKSASR